MKILALTKYPYEGPSSRYRFYNYKKCFKTENIDMSIKPFFSQAYFTSNNKSMKVIIVLLSYFYRVFILLSLLIFKNKYKVVLIEYELLPYFPAVFEYLLNKKGIKYIVDYDDAIFHKYDMSTNIFIKFFFKNKIAKVMKYANSIIVCNEYLEDYAKKYNHNILRLSTVVLLDKYKKEMENLKKNESVFIIGWIGSKTTSVYVLDLLPAIEKFVNSYENVRFDLVGFDESLLSNNEVKKYHINIIHWMEDREIKNILNFDVGIMPLQSDPWSMGKCGFKLVQYMSCKKPVIASPIGINSFIVKNSENGFLADTLDEWFEAFEKLYTNKKLREKMSKNNFIKINNNFSYDKNCIEYVKLIMRISKC